MEAQGGGIVVGIVELVGRAHYRMLIFQSPGRSHGFPHTSKVPSINFAMQMISGLARVEGAGGRGILL